MPGGLQKRVFVMPITVGQSRRNWLGTAWLITQHSISRLTTFFCSSNCFKKQQKVVSREIEC